MDKYIKIEEVKAIITGYIQRNINLKKGFDLVHDTMAICETIDKMATADVVSIGCLEQIKWERDIAIEQLAEYGVGFGEKKKDLVKVRRGRWINDGKQMLINLENGYEQYRALGYPHRIILKERCSECKKITFVDRSIYYSFCPHCGAKMERKENK